MLSGISNFLFGPSADDLAETEAGTTTVLTTSPAENSEWVLVESNVLNETATVLEAECSPIPFSTDSVTPPGSSSSTPAKSDVSILSAGSASCGSADEPSDFECFRGPYLHVCDLLHDDDDDDGRPVSSEPGALSDVSSQPEQLLHPSMDECWIVTPPPCFVNAEPGSVTTGPLEDLLIEHPSMSVYHPRRWQLPMDSPVSSVDVSPVRSQSLPDHDAGAELLPPPVPAAIPHRMARFERFLHNVPALFTSGSAHPASWNGTTARLRRENSRHLLERRNRAYAISARGHPCRRNQRLALCHSGANNDRHCH